MRLLNTAGGRTLCLAGSVDAAAVEAFLRRYGREPARVDVIDAGSVTALSAPGADLLLDTSRPPSGPAVRWPCGGPGWSTRCCRITPGVVSRTDRSRKSPDRSMPSV